MSGSRVVSKVAAARRAIQLYPAGHPSYQEAIDALVSAVEEATQDGALVVNVHHGRLYTDGQQRVDVEAGSVARGSQLLADDAGGSARVAEAFEQHMIESATFQPGFDATDAVNLLDLLASGVDSSFDLAVETERRALNHVVLGVYSGGEEEEEERELRDRTRASDRAMYNHTRAALVTLSERLIAGEQPGLGDIDEGVDAFLNRWAEDPDAVMRLATIDGIGELESFHSMRVMVFSLALGHRLGLPEKQLRSLAHCALLHDIGKTAGAKGAGRGGQDHDHPVVGAQILERVAPSDPAPMLVAYEHHMYAGEAGYPQREQGYVTNPFSRMVMIADRFDTLLSTVHDGARLTPHQAVVVILREARVLLDPFLVRVFAGALTVFPVGTVVRLTDHSVGVVSGLGPDEVSPVVRIAFNPQGVAIDDFSEVQTAEGELKVVEAIPAELLGVQVSELL